MILTEKVEITINSSNKKYFNSIGYENLKNKDKLIVPVNKLNKGSHAIVKVKCDICGHEKELCYRFYLKNSNNQNLYCCSEKCSRTKAKNTSVNKYGVEHFLNSDKFKATCLERYGSENPSQVKEFKEKRKNTMIERHNVEYYVLSENFPDKSEKTSLKNYGTPHPMMSIEMKERKKEYYIKNGFNITTDEFQLYKNKVYSLTKKVKKDLLKNWNGLDYYDNEYIKNNFNLPGSHRNYPTIDHKISIFEGFKNKIKAEDIANIDNLCFTKRYLNSKKYTKLILN
jgi:hypothetical protein